MSRVPLLRHLVLASDYFTGMDQELQVMPQLEIRDEFIPRLDVTKAAKLMGMNHNTVRKGLQQVYSRGDMQYIHQVTDGRIS